MWQSVAFRLVFFSLAAVFADTEDTLYKKVGDEVVLQPRAAPQPIATILWKVGLDIAVQFDGTDVDLYRQFKERGSLNISSGELTITGLTRDDSELYTPEINSVVGIPIRLVVIPPVPTPTIIKTCHDEGTSCVLTCDGDTTDAEPVTYKWRSGDDVLPSSSKEQHVTKEDGSGEFSCELENRVSQQRSQPIPNPFITTTRNLKLGTGLLVFLCLLTAVLLLVGFHRWKAGMWFFQKNSMPWEADFWRKHTELSREVAKSGGTTADLKKEQTDEETPMAQAAKQH